MHNRVLQILALMRVSAALAIGGVGIAQASPDHSGHRNDQHCKKLHGKKRRDCEKHHGRHHR